jgi:glycosylphosphatidylinositol transamidase (GPIT) subunit GPI8
MTIQSPASHKKDSAILFALCDHFPFFFFSIIVLVLLRSCAAGMI